MNKLITTIKKSDVDEDKLKEIYNQGNKQESNDSPEKRVVTFKEPDRIEKMRRPTFELPERDYQKVKMICAFENEDVGKMLAKVVKEWLDRTELAI